jgi:DNA-binding IclR family transcriptional regulator
MSSQVRARQPGKPLHAEEDRGANTRAPQRVMQVIAALARSRDGLSLTQISAQLAVPKTSLFSLLRSLEAGGYVISENGHHRLGQETYTIAATIQKTDAFPGNVRPIFLELHKACEETVMLGVAADDWSHLVYVDVIEASSWLRYSANVGAHRPLYSTSMGLTLLAFATREQQARYLETAQLAPVTAHTITSTKGLMLAFREIRARGYVSSSGSIEGATGVSSPVFDRTGALHAAVSMAGPTARYERDAERFAELVMTCGEKMSRALGYAGDYPRTTAT